MNENAPCLTVKRYDHIALFPSHSNKQFMKLFARNSELIIRNFELVISDGMWANTYTLEAFSSNNLNIIHTDHRKNSRQLDTRNN